MSAACSFINSDRRVSENSSCMLTVIGGGGGAMTVIGLLQVILPLHLQNAVLVTDVLVQVHCAVLHPVLQLQLTRLRTSSGAGS